jgi:tRNA (guanine37-N1)-methyltransferase
MRFTILTLFPDMFEGFFKESMMKKALDIHAIDVEIINFRDFATNKHQMVDDTPYGGGPGMVIQVEPVVLALRSIKGYEEATKIIMSPQGKVYDQNHAHQLKTVDHIILLCGHYEGFDERILAYFDYELSVGDFVLTGGEIAAMVVVDSVTRLLPGVLSNQASHEQESFENHILDHPQYTRPIEFEGEVVPEVLRTGHHKNIDDWRYIQALKKTKEKRPDLYQKHIENKKVL